MEMRTELKRLHQMMKTTVVYVTHDQIEAMTLATRIAVMRNGQIEQLGTPEEIYNRPATLYVATFVGAPPMNLLDVLATNHGLLVAGSETVIPLPPALLAKVPQGRNIKLGIRPECFRAEAKGGLPLTLRCEVVELTGPELILSGRHRHPAAGRDPAAAYPGGFGYRRHAPSGYRGAASLRCRNRPAPSTRTEPEKPSRARVLDHPHRAIRGHGNVADPPFHGKPLVFMGGVALDGYPRQRLGLQSANQRRALPRREKVAVVEGETGGPRSLASSRGPVPETPAGSAVWEWACRCSCRHTKLQANRN